MLSSCWKGLLIVGLRVLTILFVLLLKLLQSQNIFWTSWTFWIKIMIYFTTVKVLQRKDNGMTCHLTLCLWPLSPSAGIIMLHEDLDIGIEWDAYSCVSWFLYPVFYQTFYFSFLVASLLFQCKWDSDLDFRGTWCEGFWSCHLTKEALFTRSICPYPSLLKAREYIYTYVRIFSL